MWQLIRQPKSVPRDLLDPVSRMYLDRKADMVRIRSTGTIDRATKKQINTEIYYGSINQKRGFDQLKNLYISSSIPGSLDHQKQLRKLSVLNSLKKKCTSHLKFTRKLPTSSFLHFITLFNYLHFLWSFQHIIYIILDIFVRDFFIFEKVPVKRKYNGELWKAIHLTNHQDRGATILGVVNHIKLLCLHYISLFLFCCIFSSIFLKVKISFQEHYSHRL